MAEKTHTQHAVRTVQTLWPAMEVVLLRIADYEKTHNQDGLLASCMTHGCQMAEAKRNTLGQDVGVAFCRAYVDGLMEVLVEIIPSLSKQQAIKRFASPESDWLISKDG